VAHKNDPFLSLCAPGTNRFWSRGTQGDIYWKGVSHAHYVLALWRAQGPYRSGPVAHKARTVLALWRTRPVPFWSCGTQGDIYWP